MAFYSDLGGGRFLASAHTNGPWAEGAQHGGPPSALLGRAVERESPREDALVGRVTVEILGPVPVGELEVRSRVARPGRSVELVEAVLSAGGRDVARAAAWRVLRSPDDVAVPPRHASPPPLPPAAEDPPPAGWVQGYVQAVEWRWARGHFATAGLATVWARQRHPLVDGEEPSGLQRLLLVADSGNGVSSELDPRRHWFINPELTVHVHREPVGPWVCLDATTTVSPGGAGLATSVLSDQQGPVGVGAQALLVASR